MLLVVLRRPPLDEATVRAVAAATGLVPADVRQRLAGMLPRVLLMDADGERLRDVCDALRPAGIVGVVFDPRQVPGDDERLVARTLVLGPDGFEVQGGVPPGTLDRVPAGAVSLIQRGVRIATTRTTETTRETKLALGRALLTGGLILTKEVERKTTREEHTRAPFLLLHRDDGGPDVILYERQMDFRFLGADMDAGSRANMMKTEARLRRLCRRAAFDDRAMQPGFVSGFPATGRDALDVALYAVQLAHLHGLG